MLKKILAAPTQELGKCARFVVFQIRLWPQCAKLLRKNRAHQQAAALSYHTLFGLVPLAVVMLLVFQALGAFENVSKKVKGFVYEQAQLNIEYPEAMAEDGEPNEPLKMTTVSAKIDQYATGYYAKVNKGSIGIIGVVVTIWAALALLATVERAFNNIWHVTKGRNFVHKIINYWALLTLGPLLLGLAVYVSTKIAFASQLQTSILPYIAPIVPYIISVVLLFFFYFIIPNTKVNVKAALWGAVIAALAWTLAKWGFKLYVLKLPYSKVYGALGLIPLAVLWIYITWLIVLFGLQLTFTTQHLKTLEATEKAAKRKDEDQFIANEFTVIDVMRFIFRAFEHKQVPVAPEVVCSELSLPPVFGQRILDHLVNRGFLVKVSEPQAGFAPATSADNISLAEIAAVITCASFATHEDRGPILEQIAVSYNQNLSQCTLKQILSSE